MNKFLFKLSLLLLLSIASAPTFAAEEAVAEEATKEVDKGKTQKLVDIRVARGLFSAKIPADWKQKPLRSSIIEREYAVEPTKGDENGGRLTMMASGGSIKMNVERWYGQFKQADGSPTEKVAKVTEKKVGDLKVTVVDIPGNFKESIGPPRLGKTVDRVDYRMLGAIVQSKALGPRMYFFKLYGPKKTMAEAKKPFMAMVESLEMVKEAR